MAYGDVTLELIDTLLAEGVRHIALLMRHSAREFATGKHDLLNPLTDEGRELARQMGAGLPTQLLVRAYSSPAERCVETADLILEGHANAGGKITRNRPAEALGVFYILDQMRMYKAMQAAGGQVPLLEQWFEGEVGVDVMIPPGIAARLVAGFAAKRFDDVIGEPQLDLLVSHDMTLYTIRDRLLHQPASRHGDVNFLDGIAIYRQDGELFIRSHHGVALPLDVGVQLSD
ncbi:MAG TPA: histidine phosphatase family protein [Pseudomonadales bacterium]|nr:histidine phosphatase family protein [Pseudomonadales bacterium]